MLSSTKLEIEKKGREAPIGCKCINLHDQGVILMTIDNSRRDIEDKISKGRLYNDVLQSQLNDLENLESTRKKVRNIPQCK